MNSPATWSSLGFIIGKARLLHANRKEFPNSGLREVPIIRCPFAFPVCGDLFEFLGELTPAALLNPRTQTRHFRRPEGSGAPRCQTLFLVLTC